MKLVFAAQCLAPGRTCLSFAPRGAARVALALISLLPWLSMSGLRTFSAGVTQLYAFTNFSAPSGLVQAVDGNFFGTASSNNAGGLVFRITPEGAFTPFVGLPPSVASPSEGGAPIQDADGVFYSTSHSGGANGYGSIFRTTTNREVALLASFNGTNGAYPSARLTSERGGYRYGTTPFGGASFRTNLLSIPGTAFKVSSNGTVTTLVSFNGTNGATPQAPLIWGANGLLYGTTLGGGTGNFGTLFQLTTNGTFTSLFAFSGTNGANPYGGLIQTAEGSFYGTTVLGGAHNLGTIFRLTPDGVLTTLVAFDGQNGSYPYTGLIQGRDGGLYGTTEFGGLGFDGSLNDGFGTAFRVSVDGDLNTLAFFDDLSGSHPVTELVQGKDGNFYGTCAGGGNQGVGSIYRFASQFLAELLSQPAGGSKLRWNAVKGFTYQPQTLTDLGSRIWSNLGNPSVATNSSMSITLSSITEVRRFFRVLQSP